MTDLPAGREVDRRVAEAMGHGAQCPSCERFNAYHYDGPLTA